MESLINIYMDTYKKEREVWEAKHPGKDYDEYINNLVDAEKGK